LKKSSTLIKAFLLPYWQRDEVGADGKIQTAKDSNYHSHKGHDEHGHGEKKEVHDTEDDHQHEASGHHGKGHFHISLKFRPNEKQADLHIHTNEERNHFLGIDYSLIKDLPQLPSLRFSKILTNAVETGYVGACFVDRKTVVTLDRGNYTHDLNSCYTLVSADCSDQPHYAILLNKKDNRIGMKLYMGGDALEIVPTGDSEFTIKVNDEAIADPTKGFSFPEDDPEYPIFKLIQKGPFVHIVSKPLAIYIQYSAFSSMAIIPSQFRSDQCGLCGNFDKNKLPVNDLIGPHQCSLRPTEMTPAYTLQDDTCKEKIRPHVMPADCKH